MIFNSNWNSHRALKHYFLATMSFIFIITLSDIFCNIKPKPDLFYRNINLRITGFNSECSISNDKFRISQLCNTILFETINNPKLYMEINTCNLEQNSTIHIDTKWFYNHQIGDIIHFDYLLKNHFFTIKHK